MSKKNVERFYEALANDAALQEKVMNLVSGKEVNNLIVTAAKNAGYDFDEKDVEEYANDQAAGLDTAVKDWNCSCYAAGSGFYKGEYRCGCFLGGGGTADPDGNYLVCVGAGFVKP